MGEVIRAFQLWFRLSEYRKGYCYQQIGYDRLKSAYIDKPQKGPLTKNGAKEQIIPTKNIAAVGVRNRLCSLPKTGEIIWALPIAKSNRVAATMNPFQLLKIPSIPPNIITFPKAGEFMQ